MTDTPETNPQRPRGEPASDDRRARLAQTLRANLKRRKQQSRQRKQDLPSQPAPDQSED